MISFYKTYSIKKCREYWNNLQNNTDGSVSPFLNYNFVENFVKHRFAFNIANKEIPVFYVFVDDSKKVICIAPLCEKFFSKEASTLGYSANIADQDFIYDSINESQMQECIDILLRHFDNLKVGMINSESILYKALLERKVTPCLEVSNCSIPLYESYEEYVKTLSKNTRQNIRTAYNRMQRDNKNYKFLIFSNDDRIKKNCEVKGLNILPISQTDFSKKIYDESVKMYIGRRISRYKLNSHRSFLHKLFVKFFHYNTVGLRKLENTISFVLLIEDKVAAFCAGYIDNKTRVVVPRLAIAEEFSFYSPGIVLINESMKVIQESLRLSQFDLSIGNEGYKTAMGGGEYKTFCFDLRSN